MISDCRAVVDEEKETVKSEGRRLALASACTDAVEESDWAMVPPVRGGARTTADLRRVAPEAGVVRGRGVSSAGVARGNRTIYVQIFPSPREHARRGEKDILAHDLLLTPRKRGSAPSDGMCADASHSSMYQLPYLAASLLQILFNAVVAGVSLYLLIALVLNVRSDVRRKVADEIEVLELGVARCAHQYDINYCGELASRSPHMREQCTSWEKCMNRDTSDGALTTRLLAETLAEVINSFVEPLATRSMLFIVAAVVTVIVLSNFVFSLTRHRICDSNYLRAEATFLQLQSQQMSRGNQAASDLALEHSSQSGRGLFVRSEKQVPFAQSAPYRGHFFAPEEASGLREEVATPSFALVPSIPQLSFRIARNHAPAKVSRPSFHIEAPDGTDEEETQLNAGHAVLHEAEQQALTNEIARRSLHVMV
eukprot:CAMPEP_0185836868 /NCGR_PEP_ID=MMETSP1353-20130828/10421_1 /TAXON_ID=1077150 /ORGANISM="Erythrolobus australicus, Strain CCMP3124" /LENGTH=424 /DNA_ID=CAMNT_0028535709 /DNA_START=289 /DNA_END=1564 /DNA_ORIENTATION=-